MKLRIKRGFTLIELIITLALLTMVITATTNAILLLYRSHAMTVDEYTLQSSIRNTSSRITDIIRYSQAVFAVPIEYVQTPSKMDPEWEYIALSPDKRSVLKYKYNTTTLSHDQEVLVAAQPNIEYEIVFKKQSAQTQVVNGNTTILNDNMLYFTIEAYIVQPNEDGNLVRTSQKVVYETEVTATNALQVIDKGTELSPAVALAFRKDDNTYGEGRSHVVKIGLVLDKSGSMAWVPGKDNVYPGSSDAHGLDSRLNYLKKALIGSGLDGESGMVAQFAVYPNFEISIVPFSEREYSIENSDRSIPFFNAQAEKPLIVSSVNDISAAGNTNTGDGIRRAYYNLTERFAITGYNPNVEQHDFTIILVDGDSNMVSATGGNYQWVFRFNPFAIGNYWVGVNSHITSGTVYNVIHEGSILDSPKAFDFVSNVGNKIRTTDGYTGEYYLIGYVKVPQGDADGYTDGIKNIKDALNIPAEQVFMYSDTNFDLSEIFANIATDIMAKTWLVTGPQIQN